MIYNYRFGWLEYFVQQKFYIRIIRFLFGIPFLHTRQIAYWFFKLIPISQKDNVLDLGTGDGIFANWLNYFHQCNVFGIDRLKQRIDLAIKITKRYSLSNKFLVTDIDSGKFTKVLSTYKQKFTRVLIIDVLEHLNNPQKTLGIISEYIEPTGLLFISTPAPKQHRIFLKSYEPDFSYGPDKHITIGFETTKLKTWLKNSNFEIIEVKQIYWWLYQVAWEISEFIKKYHIIYFSLFPLLALIAATDRRMKLGRYYNGIIIKARKI